MMVAFCMFTGCNNATTTEPTAEPVPEHNSDYVGTWTLVSSKKDGNAQFLMSGMEVKRTLNSDGTTEYNLIDTSKDPEEILDSLSGTWSSLGNTFTIIESGESTTYSVKGDEAVCEVKLDLDHDSSTPDNVIVSTYQKDSL